MTTATDERTLHERVEALDWYHTLELAPGVLTAGWFDTRGVVGRLPFPSSLAGKRCLDIGTFDGFWAFEMERRGASEVVAIDVLDPAGWDWPANTRPETVEEIGRRKARGAGFELAREALGSSVERLELSVYDLDPDEVGSFDFVYIGSLLVHLRDPVRALEAARRVCAGELLLVDGIDLALTLRHPRKPVAALDARGRPWWWTGNAAAIVRMLEGAQFEVTAGPQRLFMPSGAGNPAPRLRPRTLLGRDGRSAVFHALRGDPHVAILAR